MSAAASSLRLALAAMVAVAAGWLLVEALTPRPEFLAYTVDHDTGEIWACAGGVCQTND